MMTEHTVAQDYYNKATRVGLRASTDCGFSYPDDNVHINMHNHDEQKKVINTSRIKSFLNQKT